MTPEVLDRIPPHDAAAEWAVLGCILLNGRRLDDVASILQPDDFYSAAYGTIYRQVLAMHEDTQPVDDLTLLGQLPRRNGHCLKSTHQPKQNKQRSQTF